MPDPAGFVQNQKRGDLQVFDGIGWRASTQTTVGVALSSPGGVRATFSGWPFVQGRRLDIVDGSTTSPQTTDAGSFVVSRTSSVAGGAIQDAAIVGIHHGTNDTAGITSVALLGYAQQYGNGDVVGVSGNAVVDSSAHAGDTAYGAFFTGVNFRADGYVVGHNAVVQTLRDQAYTVTPPFSNGVFVQAVLASGGTTGQAYRVPFGVGIFANTPADVTFDVGFAAIQGVKAAAFRDDSAALRGLDLHGSGYDAAIDITNATIHSGGSQVKLQGGVAYTPTVSPGAGAFTTVTASGHYILLGKLLYFSLVITQTNIGTGSGTITFPLPLSLTSRDGTSLSGYGTVNKSLQCQIATGSGTVTLMYYDGTSAVQNGNFLVVSGFVEVA